MTINIYNTHTLLGAVEKAGIKFDPLFLRLFFKRSYYSRTKKIILDLIPVDTPMALYCAPKIKGQIIDAEGYETKVFTPPYTKPKHEVDLDRVLTRKAGDSPFNPQSSPEDNRDAIIMDNLALEEKAINQLEEFQAVEAVLHGKIEASSDKHEKVVINMGRSANNNITLTGDDCWSALDVDSHDPDDDIEEWAMSADGAINLIIMDRLAWSSYKSFQAVKDRQNQRRGTNSALETGLKDLGMAVSYKGETGTGVHVLVYEGEYIDEDGVTQNYMPENTVVLGHTAIEGLRLYGLIQNSKAVKEGLAEASRYPRHWIEDGDPVGEYTQTESAPAMYLPKPDQFVVITVD